MERQPSNQSIILSESDIASLFQREGKLQQVQKQEKRLKNLRIKEKLRRIKEHDLSNEVKQLEKRRLSRTSTRTNQPSQVQIIGLQSFKSVKQRVKLQYQEKIKISEEATLQPWQLQELGYTTFRTVRQRPKNLLAATFGERKDQQQMSKLPNLRRKADL